MGLLERYEVTPPKPVPKPSSDLSGETRGLTGALMRFSGGLIANARQAMYVMFVFATILFAISIILVLLAGRTESNSRFPPVPVTGRELEDVNWPPP